MPVFDGDIKIDKSEVRRYLGCGAAEADSVTEDMIDCCADELCSKVRPRYIYKIFTTKIGFDGEKSYIYPEGTELRLDGEDIYEHLRTSKKTALMAATLGIEADTAIRNAQGTDMLRAVVLDACASELIEKVCDNVEARIRAEAETEGLRANYRFSPGYGDLPIETQGPLLRVLDTGRRIGLTLTDSFIMVPGKSVSAIIGLGRPLGSKRSTGGCAACSMRDRCRFRREGMVCGRGR